MPVTSTYVPDPTVYPLNKSSAQLLVDMINKENASKGADFNASDLVFSDVTALDPAEVGSDSISRDTSVVVHGVGSNSASTAMLKYPRISFNSAFTDSKTNAGYIATDTVYGNETKVYDILPLINNVAHLQLSLDDVDNDTIDLTSLPATVTLTAKATSLMYTGEVDIVFSDDGVAVTLS